MEKNKTSLYLSKQINEDKNNTIATNKSETNSYKVGISTTSSVFNKDNIIKSTRTLNRKTIIWIKL